MDISSDRHDEITVITASGRLDGVGAPEIEAYGKKLIESGASRLLLDMAAVDYVSSAGLRGLLVLARATQAAAGQLVLCRLSANVREVMTISGFDSILHLAADRAGGLTFLQPQATTCDNHA
ncbi:MAG: STAS domain-containing protein [Deltaproteobacteria bacterium]|nr:STAS domain-containing protein [Deltaproteobacteria bacterium]